MFLKELNQFQIFSLCILGVIYWGLAVLAIRHAGHIMFANDLRRFIMYLASIPLLYVTMVFSEGLVGIDRKQRLASVILMTASATLFDGTALMWFPILYENPTIRKTNLPAAVVISRMGAAWILYGVAASFFIVALT
jgi:hypothetical protein